jgi:uncharacterized protein YdeI (YjbR/CyaY-like superfamily)
MTFPAQQRPSVMSPRFFPTAAAFRAWLKANHALATELLVGFHRVDSRKPSMTWPESVDEALCYGWIGWSASSGVTGRGGPSFRLRRLHTGASPPTT